jgi:FkbM family methyltransferase
MIERIHTFAKLLGIIKQKIDTIRTDEKRQIRFLQLGAADGIKCDFVAQITNKDDFGILVEPYNVSFVELLKNKPKSEFPNYTFHNYAVLPEKFYNLDLKFNIEVPRMKNDLPTGNHFFTGQTRHGCDFVEGECTKVSLKKFIEESVINTVDVLILDIEGFDGDIVMEYVDIQQPHVIVFEYWEIIDKELGLEIESLEKVVSKLNALGYNVIGFKDDYCAFKNVI